jgi:hypothetical protein
MRMKADLRSQSPESKFIRLLAGAAVAIALSTVVAASPAYADSDWQNSGGWNRDSDHRDGRQWGHQRGNQWGNHWGNHWGNQGGRYWYSQPYAFRHQPYPARRWHANSYSGWGYPWYGPSGGASITLNVPFR